MADFIYFEADASDESNDEGERMTVDDSLIDDSQHHGNDDPTFFRFHNQTRDLQEVMSEIAQEEEIAAEYMEANNYLEDCEIDDIGNEPFDEFEKFGEKRDLFLRFLKNPVENQTKELTLFNFIVCYPFSKN